MILLADADIIIYRAASIHQESFIWDEECTSVVADLEAAKASVDSFVADLVATTKCKDGVLMALSSAEKNFRYSVLETYKHNRADTVRPVLREALTEYVMETYPYKRKATTEGDDVLGILGTAYPGKYLLATIDKDLQQIPGKHYNWNTGKFSTVTKKEGERYFFMQVLTGDTTDGYKGCPGIGKVKAEKILQEAEEKWQKLKGKRGKLSQYYWEAIVQTYAAKGLTEEDAIQQARVARILQCSDYNFKKDEVVLWTPPKLPTE